MSIKIYYGIFSKNMKYEYNLKEDNIYHIIDFTEHKENDINNLNEYLGELCTMYYVWKNNLKSEYVGFCHYRMFYCDFALNELKNGYVQTRSSRRFTNEDNSFDNSLYTHCKYLNINEYLLVSYNRYLIEKHNININLCTDNIIGPNYCNMFICSWEHFNDLCKFIFGFLDYIMPNESWKDLEQIEYLRNLLISYGECDLKICNIDDTWRYSLGKRMFPFLFETLLGAYISNKFKFIDYHPLNPLSIYIKYDNDNDFDEREFLKWHHKQIGSGISSIYLLYNDKLNFEFGESDFLYAAKYTILLNKNDHDKLPENSIKLNIDEYIDVVNPHHFYKTGVYEIKKR